VPILSAYQSLPSTDQLLHGLHFMLCSFAVLVACVPLLTEKGSPEHKFAGLIYLPISLAALLFATSMAWRESSAVLFCFNCFCTYLLMSGWRAVHEPDAPSVIDWMIPSSLFLLSIGVTIHALINDQGMSSMYLIFFALNGFFLSWRDWKHLQRRAHNSRHKVVFAGMQFGVTQNASWIGRHVAGMVGSMIANLSVVVLTVLPIELHWLWPVSLLAIGIWISRKEQQKKQRVRATMVAAFKPKFSPPPRRLDDDEDFRRAA